MTGSFRTPYWLHESRGDLIRQSPASDGETRGTFSLRSPVRPNPIGTALASLVARDGPTLFVKGLDCLDGTPLIDLKPDRCRFTNPAISKRAEGSDKPCPKRSRRPRPGTGGAASRLRSEL